MTKHLTTLAALVAVALPLSACSGSDSGSASPSASTTTSQTASGTPSTTPSVVPTTPAKPKVRTAADLAKALLALKDLPSGWSVEKPGEGDENAKLTSTDPKCATFVKVMNLEHAPGSKAAAERGFSGGQNGPFVDESLDWMGSVKAVSALQKSFSAGARGCHKVMVDFGAQGGSSTFTVAEVSAPTSGTAPFAVRLTATSGNLAGLEMVVVVTGIDDVVLALLFVGATPDDVDAATDDAVTKAQRVLGGTTGS
ncbi:MAG TPA: hypothetical protein VEK80_14185 [Kribbellaceae bacterium]|nr:hypothetical protein [Kribbellaceae bacterium]